MSSQYGREGEGGRASQALTAERAARRGAGRRSLTCSPKTRPFHSATPPRLLEALLRCACAPRRLQRRGRRGAPGRRAGAPPPLPRTNRTSLVPPLVLSGHAASLTTGAAVGPGRVRRGGGRGRGGAGGAGNAPRAPAARRARRARGLVPPLVASIEVCPLRPRSLSGTRGSTPRGGYAGRFSPRGGYAGRFPPRGGYAGRFSAPWRLRKPFYAPCPTPPRAPRPAAPSGRAVRDRRGAGCGAAGRELRAELARPLRLALQVARAPPPLLAQHPAPAGPTQPRGGPLSTPAPPPPPAPQSEEVAEALAKHSGRGLRALLVRPPPSLLLPLPVSLLYTHSLPPYQRPAPAPAPARLLRAAPGRAAGPPARRAVASRSYRQLCAIAAPLRGTALIPAPCRPPPY